MSKEANSSKSNKKKRRHYSVLAYLTTPLIYVLISMIVIAPMCFGAMKVAVNTVHDAQKTLTRDFNDIEAKTDYEPSDKKNGNTQIPVLSSAQKLGVITCENAGLNTDVYYGINRVSLRNGVAIDVDAPLCGMSGVVQIYGYSSTGFKALFNVEFGDIISIETIWGSYSYKVISKDISANVPSVENKNCLILATEKDKNAFSSFDKDKLFVVAEQISGPIVEEVQL